MGDQLTFNLADLWEAVADRTAEREAVVCGDRRLTYAQLEERANRLSHHLASAGVGPGDFVGCYLRNGTEYLEAILACTKLRAVAVNVNYRYVAEELRYLLEDSGCVALLCGAGDLERVAAAAAGLPSLRHVLVVAGPGSHGPDRDGFPDAVEVVDYESALVAASPERPVVADRGEDDLYVIYTGGTTGLPKGVVWRQGDAFFGCLGGGDPMRMQGPVESPEEVLDRIVDFDFTFYALAPLMHAAAQWVSLMWLLCGARVVLHQGSFDPLRVWRTIEAEKVSATTVVGDAMARPLCDTWDTEGPFDTSSLFSFSNGGAPLSPTTLARLREMLPGCVLTDGFGSSETGIQGSRRFEAGAEPPSSVAFDNVAPGTRVLDEHLRPVEPGSGVVGRVAHCGHVPLRYHNAPEKTAETFVEVDGTRYVLSGDMALVEADGSVVLLGRGSVSINTGGEKVYPEEVESVVKGHPAVYDALVVGVPHERWGEQVTVLVQPVPGSEAPSVEELADHCRAHLAGYKVPRAVVPVAAVVRSPAGKADYRWGRATAAEALDTHP